MSGWDAYVAYFNGYAESAAIVSKDGALCGKFGSWSATQSDMSGYAAICRDIEHGGSLPLTYKGVRYIINRCADDTCFGMKGKEGLVLQKTNTLIVVAHVNEKYAPNLAAGKCDQVAKMLKDQGL